MFDVSGKLETLKLLAICSRLYIIRNPNSIKRFIKLLIQSIPDCLFLVMINYLKSHSPALRK